MVKYKIKRKYDHYEVYINGKFYCSVDTTEEAVRERYRFLMPETFGYFDQLISSL